MKDELKPCPFCGNEAKAYEADNGEGFDFNYVECMGCSVTFEGQVGRIAGEDELFSDVDSMKALIDKWNKRI